MNEIIIAVNKYDCGCVGKRYKGIREAIANGSYSVWTYERIRAFNEIADDPVLYFKNGNQNETLHQRTMGEQVKGGNRNLYGQTYLWMGNEVLQGQRLQSPFSNRPLPLH